MGKSCGKKDATDNADEDVDLQLASQSKAGAKRKERPSSPAEEAKQSKVTPPNAAGTKRKERASRSQTPPPDAKKAKKAKNTNHAGPRQIVAGLTGYAACANGVYIQQDEEEHSGHPFYTVQPL